MNLDRLFKTELPDSILPALVTVGIEKLENLGAKIDEHAALSLATMRDRDELVRHIKLLLPEIDHLLSEGEHPQVLRHPDYQKALAKLKQHLLFKVRELQQSSTLEEQYPELIELIRKLGSSHDNSKKGFDGFEG